MALYKRLVLITVVKTSILIRVCWKPRYGTKVQGLRIELGVVMGSWMFKGYMRLLVRSIGIIVGKGTDNRKVIS